MELQAEEEINMARTWTEGDWHDEKIRIARDAAKSYVEKRNFEGKSQRFIDAVEKEMFRKAVDEFNEKYPFDKITDTQKDAVAGLKGDDAAKLLGLTGGNDLFRNSYDPLVKKKMDDFAKLGPLVLGLADEGRDWYNMGATDLFAKGEELGYDTKSKKGKMDFLRDVGDVQMAHDRGKLLEEFNKESNILTEMYYPTMMEEMRKQISTGRGSTADVVLSGLLDIGINRGMAYAPSVSGIGRLANMPIRGAAAGSLLQGAIEGARQGGKTLIDDELEADLSAPLLATTLGATRPGMIGTVSTVAQQIPTSSANRFAAGVSAATRGGSPSYMEREAFDNTLESFLKKQHLYSPNRETIAAKSEKLTPDNLSEEQVKTILGGETAATYTLPEIAYAKLSEKAIPQIKALYGEEKANQILEKFINKDEILKKYDDLPNLLINRSKYDASKKLNVGKELVNGELREDDVLTNLEKAFPAKMAEAYGNDKWYKRGVMAGQILGDIGGRIEPVLKVNPFGALPGGNVNMVNTDYKETPWYKSLSKKQQEAFDDAYEKSKRASE